MDTQDLELQGRTQEESDPCSPGELSLSGPGGLLHLTFTLNSFRALGGAKRDNCSMEKDFPMFLAKFEEGVLVPIALVRKSS